MGTEFLKVAVSDYVGNAKIFEFPEVGIAFPGAIAYRTSPELGKITISHASVTDPKFGRQALSLLKRNSSLGYRYAARALCRNTTDFRTTTLADPLESLSLILTHAMSRVAAKPAGITAAVPFFWPREIRQSIANAFRLCGLPVFAIIDDITALAALYAVTKRGRFANLSRPYNVVFVDVGATSAEAFGISFTVNSTDVLARPYGMQWRENLGGYPFARRVMQRLHQKRFSRGEKMLRNRPEKSGELLAGEMEQLKQLVRRVLWEGNTTDEVQILGGSSWYRFVIDALRNVSEGIAFKRDFNAREAIALGAVYASLITRRDIPDSVVMNTTSYNNVRLVCNASHVYCRRGHKCAPQIIDRGGGCEYVLLVSDAGGVPEGASNVVSASYLAVPEGLAANNETFVRFTTREDDAFVRAAEWCNGTGCQPLEVRPTSIDATAMPHLEKWIAAMAQAREERERISAVNVMVGDLVESLAAFFDATGVAAEPTTDRAAKTAQRFRDIAEKYHAGAMDAWNSTLWIEALAQLRGIAAGVGVRAE